MLETPAATPVVVTGTVTGVASAAPDVGIVGIVGIVVAIPEVGNIVICTICREAPSAFARIADPCKSSCSIATFCSFAIACSVDPSGTVIRHSTLQSVEGDVCNGLKDTCDASPERLKMRPPGPRPMDVTMSSAYAVARSSACFAVRLEQSRCSISSMMVTLAPAAHSAPHSLHMAALMAPGTRLHPSSQAWQLVSPREAA
mmetsp:Transcript_37792/g.81224  ORF Transcript_37792/g.81224 Transcript_37792/m.81224 type:complete len:201 (-) Transcript_37792:52-654(-)